MTYKEKLTAILKEIPEIKEDMEKLEFGCEVFIKNYITSLTIIGDNRGMCEIEGAEYTEFLGQTGAHTQSFQENHIEKIIGTLKERHLRTYLYNNIPDKYINIHTIVDIDDKKDFDQQDDSVYKEILEFLINNEI